MQNADLLGELPHQQQAVGKRLLVQILEFCGKRAASSQIRGRNTEYYTEDPSFDIIYCDYESQLVSASDT